MKIGQEVKPALLGAAGGAIVLAIIGFAWGGWVTGANAREQSQKNADTAVVSVLAPICAIQFRAQPDSAGKLAELDALGTYQQAKFIDEGGWAVMPGAETAVDGVARGCAVILTTKTRPPETTAEPPLPRSLNGSAGGISPVHSAAGGAARGEEVSMRSAARPNGNAGPPTAANTPN